MMIFSRAISIFLRFVQFISAVVVLGISAYFIGSRLRHSTGPLGRVIYAVVISTISIPCSLFWMIPTTSSIVGYTSDFVFSGAWFAAFGLLYRHYRNLPCSDNFNSSGYRCGLWKADFAFAIISAVFWLLSALLGLLAVHRLQKKRGVGHGSRV